MSVRDICDVAYAIQVDYAERLELALWQARATARAMGSTVELPTLGDVKRAFDAHLVSDLVKVATFESEWLHVMGLEAAS